MKGHRVILEPEKHVPVLGEYDVVVCGGGPAGCAAALGSARHGARTLLIEREGYLGGAPCTQRALSILSTNGVDFQGVWHEWARALKVYNGISSLHREARCGTTWFTGSVDPEAVKLAWDDLLTASGVEILHLAVVAGAIVEDNGVSGVWVETKAGRRAVLAGCVIDATGDADVAAAAGVAWVQGAGGQPWAMGVSLNACYGGVRTDRAYEPGRLNLAGETGRSLGNLPLFDAGQIRLLEIDPLDPWALTRAAREGRREVWARMQALRERTGQRDLYLAATAAWPGIRSSRRIVGRTTVTAEDVLELRKYPDSIARGSWEIDIHPPDSPTGEPIACESHAHRRRIIKTEQGDYYDIRYGCLLPKGIDHLLVAGRCISAEHEAQASLRIQQTCMATGQAAGVAAALSLAAGVSPRAVERESLLTILRRDRDVEPAFDVLKGLPKVQRV